MKSFGKKMEDPSTSFHFAQDDKNIFGDDEKKTPRNDENYFSFRMTNYFISTPSFPPPLLRKERGWG